ncbi:hypothetical protein GCM10009801_13730 [Streptomyces albiaxialis]|uniref:Tat pathway signal sequence domain protein n=1 Tax=Streptomyces albiaxialis TaxID=329523 RepID=A0ABN2VP71_9ACTN
MTRPFTRRTALGAATATAVTVGAGALWEAGSRTAWAGPADAPSRGPRRVHEEYVRDASPRWRRMPRGWQEAPFLGNGSLGCQVYAGERADTLKVMLSHTRVQDQRGQWRAGIGYSRLPIGYFTLTLAGEVTGLDWTLDLWDAELRGTVTTTRGSVALRALVHNGSGALLVSTEPSRGEESAAWSFTWLEAGTTRTSGKPPEYVPNDPPRTGDADGTGYCEQPLLAGGGWATAWRECGEGTRRLLAAHLVYRWPGEVAEATRAAVRAVERTLAGPPDALVKDHREWWHAFHLKSFLSVPDKRLQRFYLIQLYKLASATRAEGPTISEWGAWFPEVGNNWPALWWNLNVQIGMAPVHGSGHAELDSVTEAFRRFEKNLPLSVPEEHRDGASYALGHPSDWQLRAGAHDVGVPGSDRITDNFGNLLWAMHHVWLRYRHTMESRVLRDVLTPVLAKAVHFYALFLHEGRDGKLHLPRTRSPEYADAEDCTYDLSLLRWGATTLLECARVLRLEDPEEKRWRDIARRLTPYAHHPEQGVMVGKDVPLAGSHRHHSHLLWLHPLRERVWDRPSDREVMRRSMAHWVSMRERWHGYSFAVGSSMYSVMDEPEKALDFLTFFTDLNVVDDCQMTVNTMYREGRNLALESPLAGAQSMLDMVTQSHGGVVKVFPSVSRRWPDASVASLRAQGGFLVDADRANGRTRWVRVRSEAGEPLVLEHGVPGEVEVRDASGRALHWRQAGRGRIALDLPRGGTVVVTPRGSRPAHGPDAGPRDVPALGPSAPWGLPG